MVYDSFYDNENSAKLFPGLKEETQLMLYFFMLFLEDIRKLINDYTLQLYIFCVLFNILHIMILSRKEMRASSTNVIMIGLAACETFMIIEKYRSYWFNLMKIGIVVLSCYKETSYTAVVYQIVLYIMGYMLYRCTLWLAIVMAVIRTISIKNAMNPRFDFISGGKFGWYTVAFIYAASFITTVWTWFIFDIHHVRYKWPVKMWCPRNVTEGYTFQTNALLSVHQFSSAIIGNILPSIAFPVVTILLVWELRKARAARRKMASSTQIEKKDRTTILVVFIACSFIIAELPKGVFSWILSNPHSEGTNTIFEAMTVIFAEISMINTATRGLVCYAMSSQYRATATKLLRRGEKKVEKANAHETSTAKGSSSMLTTIS